MRPSVIPNGEIIRQLREQKGPRKIVWAEALKLNLGLSASVIYKAEKGKAVSRDTVEALAKVLGVSYNELIQAEDPLPPPSRTSRVVLVPLHLRHRSMQRERLEKALSSGGNVLWLTVMSQSATKHAQPLLEGAKKTNTQLRILTWYPQISEEVIEAYRKHLDENSDDHGRTVLQIKEAAKTWQNWAVHYSNIEVRTYSSSATMQGFVQNGPGAHCLVELLPFATHPEDRPALVLTLEHEPEAFRVFHDAFEKLWHKSEPNP